MAIGDAVNVTGYVTQEKFLIGRSLDVLESYLGFHEGRLARGAIFVKLDRLPFPAEFELAAYSMTAAHRHTPPTGLDQEKLKRIAREQWTLAGGDRLIKVLATIRHDPARSGARQRRAISTGRGRPAVEDRRQKRTRLRGGGDHHARPDLSAAALRRIR